MCESQGGRPGLPVPNSISLVVSVDVKQHCRRVFIERLHLKPVLNWANDCSPNILRTLRRTMIRFLIELLVRRIWFGQSRLYFILNWLVARCKLRPELAADAGQVKSIYFNHPSPGNSTNYYLILGLRDKAAPPTCQQINKFPPKRVKNLATPVIHFYFYFFFISALSQSEAMIVQ